MMLFQWIGEFLFPRKCLLCQGILPRQESDLCGECRRETAQFAQRGTMQDLDGWTALWYYDGPVRDSLLRYKFNGKRHYASGYGRLLAMQVSRILPTLDLITWVSVSPKRKRERGYDQSELLAQVLSRELNLPAGPTLRKVRNNPAQSGISDPGLRRKNVENVYQALENGNLTGKRVLLVDDIVTTGATSRECAKVLRRAGAKEIYLAAMAAGKMKHTAAEE